LSSGSSQLCWAATDVSCLLYVTESTQNSLAIG